MDIGTEELSHLEIIGTFARMHLKPTKVSRELGDVDFLISICGAGGVNLCNSAGNAWTADYREGDEGTELDIMSIMRTTMIVGIVTEAAIFYHSEFLERPTGSGADRLIVAGIRGGGAIDMTTIAAILALNAVPLPRLVPSEALPAVIEPGPATAGRSSPSAAVPAERAVAAVSARPVAGASEAEIATRGSARRVP